MRPEGYRAWSPREENSQQLEIICQKICHRADMSHHFGTPRFTAVRF